MWKRAVAAGAVSLACVLAAPRAPAADARVPVAILPMVVNSLDGADHLRAGLVDMLASRLGRDPRLAVIRVTEPAAATRDPQAARATARAQGAAWVVFGSFTHFGKGASLDLQCVRVAETGDASRHVFAEAGDLGEIIPKLDPLAEKLVRHVLNGPGAEPPAASPGAPTRAELDALRRRVDALEGALRAAQAGTSEPAPEGAGSDSGDGVPR